jgi:hypothetical protein
MSLTGDTNADDVLHMLLLDRNQCQEELICEAGPVENDGKDRRTAVDGALTLAQCI